jgi:hypothetical protein
MKVHAHETVQSAECSSRVLELQCVVVNVLWGIHWTDREPWVCRQVTVSQSVSLSVTVLERSVRVASGTCTWLCSSRSAPRTDVCCILCVPAARTSSPVCCRCSEQVAVTAVQPHATRRALAAAGEWRTCQYPERRSNSTRCRKVALVFVLLPL